MKKASICKLPHIWISTMIAIILLAIAPLASPYTCYRSI